MNWREQGNEAVSGAALKTARLRTNEEGGEIVATLWRRRIGDDGVTWTAHAIDAGGLSNVSGELGASSIVLATFGSGGDAVAAIFSPTETAIWVNGETVLGGMKVLAHRDEILVGGELYCYSAQSRPAVAAFALAEGERRPRCGVCRMAIEDGQATVACPQCARVFHQLEAAGEQAAKLCWTYRPACLCGHPTGLGEEDAWRPDQEECDE